jgi:hypothetical protein
VTKTRGTPERERTGSAAARPASTDEPGTVDSTERPTSDAPAARGDAAAPATTTPPVDNPRDKLIESIVARAPEAEREELRKELRAELDANATPEQLARVGEVMAAPCSEQNFRLDVPPLKQYEPRLREACTKIVADTRSFGRALWENVPKMMFLFLPLIALVMAVLYLGSGRYYVEHLLFFVHYHAFFFLAGMAVLLLDRIGAATGGVVASALGTAEGLLVAALVIYVPVYLFLAMRRVYGQGRIWTASKFSVLAIAYIFCLALTGVGLLFYTALTL